jgi:hypothetical protein
MKDEAQFQNMLKSGKNKNVVMGLDGAQKKKKDCPGEDH